MKVISIGSCLSRLTAASLENLFGCSTGHNVANVRSDVLVDYFIKKTRPQIPLERLEAFLKPKPEFRKASLQTLRNQYEPYLGFHDFRSPEEKGPTTFFQDLESQQFDCILLDNLVDTSAMLMYPKRWDGYENSGVFMNTHFYDNEAELLENFSFGGFLSPERSVVNWKVIALWLRELQPRAELVFLPFHANTSLSDPERHARLTAFPALMEPWVRRQPGMSLIPPIEVGPELWQSAQDWTHRKGEVYRALAGVVFLTCRGGLGALGSTPLRAPAAPEAAPAPPAIGNPYKGLPDTAFWRRAVAGPKMLEVDPVGAPVFRIENRHRIATAGSCFAQHISKTLVREGYNYLITERAPASDGAKDESYGLFPARFGNIYTTRQFLQLFERACDDEVDTGHVWRREDGRYIDAFRPYVQSAGFETPEACLADRAAHLRAVRRMFDDCDVLIFTLGLTEGWRCSLDGAAVPFPPGAAGASSDVPYAFCNLTAEECSADLETLIDRLRARRPQVKLLLTVSPVPLIATYEPRHVLVSTTYSKAALRVAADSVSRSRAGVGYFPSYEIITGAYTRSAFFEDDLREVRPEGVARVMQLFKQHYLNGDSVPTGAAPATAEPSGPAPGDADIAAYLSGLHHVICDEEKLDALYKPKAGG